MKYEAELISSVQSGEKDAFNEIIKLFEPLVRSAVESYLVGGSFTDSDRDDLYQEATIALYNAVMSYDLKQSEVTFGLYAKICLNNSLNSALRRQKRRFAADNQQTSYGTAGFDSNNLRSEPQSSDSDMLDDASLLLNRIERILSPFERIVFKHFIHGAPHKEIAETLGKSEKSIDNAVYRIRRKLVKKLL